MLCLVDLCQSGRIIDGGDGADLLELHIVRQRQADKGKRGDDGAIENKGRAAAQLMAAFVGDGAKQREHEQRQDIIQRHDDARGTLGQTELIGQNQRDGVVVGLPEGANQKEGKAYKNGFFVIQLHVRSVLSCCLAACRAVSSVRIFS